MKRLLQLVLVIMFIPGGELLAKGHAPKETVCVRSYVDAMQGANFLVDIDYSYEALTNGTVRFVVHNNTAVGFDADIIRGGVVYPPNDQIITEFSVPSGGSYFYIDDSVTPGMEYQYIFEYHLDGTIEWIFNFDNVTAVSTIPALGTFNLYAGQGDEDYDWLREDATIMIEGTTIRASASGDGITQSVVFLLNGRRSMDNTFPFTLFGDVPDQAKKARLKNGSYELVAIAYPARNGKGIAGDTARVNFHVDIRDTGLNLSIIPNPVRENTKVEADGDAGTAVEIIILEMSGAMRRKLFEGKLNAEGKYTCPLSAHEYTPGIYLVILRSEEQSLIKRVIIE